MKCYNETDSYELKTGIAEALENIRYNRGFDTKKYIKDKTRLLNTYMQVAGLDTCIVAVSGGIDSAVVLALAVEAKKFVCSPIKNIIPVLLPCYDNDGVTGQLEATQRGIDVCKQYGLTPIVINMQDIASLVSKTVEDKLSQALDDWGNGQAVPYCRTPVLYTIATAVNVSGHKGIILGTTNFSEGGYLGYVGKASDGMVDVQMISDIYKSEVYKVAEVLNVPSSVYNVTPVGDMFDNRSDVEVFGAPYDFVELYQEVLRASTSSYDLEKVLIGNFNREDRNQYLEWKNNLEKLHSYNAHKYLAGSPAVHLDLWESNVPNGWHNMRWIDE